MTEATVSPRVRTRVFTAGTVAVIVGVLLHLPDFVSAADNHYMMSSMGVSARMTVGMGLILAGTAAAVWAVAWRTAGLAKRLAPVSVQALEDRRLTGADAGRLAFFTVALVIDAMKPATLGFVMPGMKAEYHLTAYQVSLLPMMGLGGTVVGSLVWGAASDRIGRRSAMLLAVVMFVSTAICGVMPSYGWNLVMCFLMGLAAGGLLPVAFSLLAESLPRQRFRVVAVLVSGIGGAGGYLAAAGSWTLLNPTFGWRILWLLGLPTGLALLPFLRFVPESPRYLLLSGRPAEAEAAATRLGARLVSAPEADAPYAVAPAGGRRARRLALSAAIDGAGRPGRGTDVVVTWYGFAVGLVNLGLLTWLPTILPTATAHGVKNAAVLGEAAVVALPLTVLLSLLYARWRTTGSLAVVAACTGAAALGIAAWSAADLGRLTLFLLVVVVLTGINSAIAILGVYSADVYPTGMRGEASGAVAGATKLGGLVGPQVMAVALSVGGGVALPITVLSVPLVLAGAVIVRFGVRDRVPAPHPAAVAVGAPAAH